MTAVFVSGNPLPKERPRVVNGHAYTPRRTLAWENAIVQAYVNAAGRKFTGPIELSLVFWRDSKRRVDVDNLIKAVADALNGHAWDDDSQIIHLEAWKCYADETHPTGVMITVSSPTSMGWGVRQ